MCRLYSNIWAIIALPLLFLLNLKSLEGTVEKSCVVQNLNYEKWSSLEKIITQSNTLLYYVFFHIYHMAEYNTIMLEYFNSLRYNASRP